jgi:hypothetical protein
VKQIRLAFGGMPGTVRVRLMTTWGRSYPGGWPDLDAVPANLIPAIDLDVPAPDPETYLEIDVTDLGVFLEPTQHYVVAVEHLGPAPQLAIESTAAGDPSRALIHVPGEDTPYGLGEANFRIELAGDHFCAWTDAERFFGEHTDTPFAAVTGSYIQLADLDDDGHDDVVVQGPGPLAYFGDGGGNFVPAVSTPFPGATDASLLVFADVDGDGDLGWLELELEGTTSNRDAVGARVTVVAGGMTQTRDVEAGGGHHRQHSHVLHFGLADAAALDSVTVRWPTGAIETISGAEVRNRYRIVEGSGVAAPL